MAVYHLKVGFGSRAGGQSARAKNEYIEREGRYADDREEREHVEHGHMPAWAQDDPHAYWQAADAHERANGRLYSEVQFALPRELDAGRAARTRGRVRRAGMRRGAAALYARPPQGRGGDPRQAGQPPRAPDVLGARQ